MLQPLLYLGHVGVVFERIVVAMARSACGPKPSTSMPTVAAYFSSTF